MFIYKCKCIGADSKNLRLQTAIKFEEGASLENQAIFIQ